MDRQQQEREACLQLKAKGLTRKEIAERLGLSERVVKRRLSASANGNVNRTKFGRAVVADVKAASISTGVISDPSSTADKFINGLGSKISFEDEYESVFFGSAEEEFSFPLSKDQKLYRFEQGDKKREQLKQYIEGKYRGKKVKILYLADLHIPFTMYREVLAICHEHRDADIVVINGDLLDLFAVSKFAKDKEIALRRELEEGRELLEFLSKRFKDIIITEGNHERRLRSYIKAVIPTDMQFLFPDDCLQMIQSGEVLDKEELENVHVVGSWWIKLFETIIAHPDNYSNANLKTVQNTSEYFSLIKGIGHKACIIGHTHKAGKMLIGDVLLMETGCLCYDMDYHNGSNFTKTKWTRAYAVININESGEPDYNDTNVVLL